MGFEPGSVAPRRGDARQPERGAGRGIGEPTAQARHRDVEGLRGAEPVLVPDLGLERLAGHCLSHVLGRHDRQLELLWSQGDFAVEEQAAVRTMPRN
jgi:hypothetical protein